MLFSVLIVSSNPTLFINNGSRNNYGKLSKKNTFEKEGVYIECDVLKFEKKYVIWNVNIWCLQKSKILVIIRKTC